MLICRRLFSLNFKVITVSSESFKASSVYVMLLPKLRHSATITSEQRKYSQCDETAKLRLLLKMHENVS